MKRVIFSLLCSSMAWCLTASAIHIAYVSEKNLMSKSKSYQKDMKISIKLASNKKKKMEKIYQEYIDRYNAHTRFKAVLNRSFYNEQKTILKDAFMAEEKKIHQLVLNATNERARIRRQEQKRIQGIIKAYAKKHHIDLILNKRSVFLNNNDDIVDITPKITELLNEASST